jgi:copper chaperone
VPLWSLRVNGLHCQSCVRTVIEELSDLPEITSVSVELGTDEPSTVMIDATKAVSDARIQTALHEGGDFDIVQS